MPSATRSPRRSSIRFAQAESGVSFAKLDVALDAVWDFFAAAFRRQPTFAAVFLALLATTTWIGVTCPLGPGQDAHYHFFSAAVTARLWQGDRYYRALYETLNPLDSNTLVYTFLFPFELVMKPLSAWRTGWTLYYFVGYPVASAVALKLLRRPPWGALLAVPLAYTVKTYSSGGYVPFVSAAPWFVLAVALLFRVNEGTATRRMQIAAALVTAFAFLAHAHAYSWLMVVLAIGTLLAIGGAVLRGFLFDRLAALRDGLVIGIRALTVVVPSLALFAAWFFRTHHGSHADQSWALKPVEWTLEGKVSTVWALFVHIKGEREFGYFLGFVLVVFSCLALGRRRREPGVPIVEVGIGLSFVSWWLLPTKVSGQLVADRQMDLALWMLPLAVYVGEPLGGRFRHALSVTMLTVWSALRLWDCGTAMRALREEFAGMLALSKRCPGPGELAYIAPSTLTATWYSEGMQQAHETLAAICHLDTPIYDRVYPHNLLPLRYRELPAPVTILVGSPRTWWTRPEFKPFDYVLVQGWEPTAEEIAAAGPAARLLGRSGVWSLWARTNVVRGPAP